jgi:hypothetical protein
MTAVAVAVAGTHGGSQAVTTIRLVEKNQGFHFIDNPPLGGPNQPPSAGDEFVLFSSLWTKSGNRAGTLRAPCTVVEGGPNGTVTCFGTFGLKGGQLAGIATVRNDARVTRIAIVGGTGAYEGARGSVASVSRGNNSPFSDDTIRLLP